MLRSCLVCTPCVCQLMDHFTRLGQSATAGSVIALSSGLSLFFRAHKKGNVLSSLKLRGLLAAGSLMVWIFPSRRGCRTCLSFCSLPLQFPEHALSWSHAPSWSWARRYIPQLGSSGPSTRCSPAAADDSQHLPAVLLSRTGLAAS